MRALGKLAGIASVAAVVAFLPTRSDAGIVVLESGRTFVGTIDPDAVTADEVTVRWRRGERGDMESGSWTFQRREVRWFDVEADAPTAEYWEAHADDPIEPRWHEARERWRALEETPRVPPDPHVLDREEPLSPHPLERRHFRLRKPRGWQATAEEGVTMLVAPRAGTAGFAPRVHVFSVAAPAASPEDQLAWIEDELARLARRDGYEVTEEHRLRRGPGGAADKRLLTLTEVEDRRIAALREVRFRKGRTTVFAAYAHEDDFAALRPLFTACLESLRLHG